jgi:hypothetical protein
MVLLTIFGIFWEQQIWCFFEVKNITLVSGRDL